MPRDPSPNNFRREWNVTSPDEPDFPFFCCTRTDSTSRSPSTGFGSRPPLDETVDDGKGSQTKSFPRLAALTARISSHIWYAGGKQQEPHREKVKARGDWTDELLRWYALVAKPVPRKDLAKIPAAEEAVAKEWAKLRAADSGRGTWNEK